MNADKSGLYKNTWNYENNHHLDCKVKIYTIDKFDDENIRSIGVHLCLSAVNKRYLKGKVTWAKLLVLI